VSGAILPIGQLSEEAQESINKDLKYFRSSHSRKISRSSTNEDVLIYFLFPRIHLSRVWENCQKRLPKYICQKHYNY
jgi:hypothetical protein